MSPGGGENALAVVQLGLQRCRPRLPAAAADWVDDDDFAPASSAVHEGLFLFCICGVVGSAEAAAERHLQAERSYLEVGHEVLHDGGDE